MLFSEIEDKIIKTLQGSEEYNKIMKRVGEGKVQERLDFLDYKEEEE